MMIYRTFGDFELLTTIIADMVKLWRLERILASRQCIGQISNKKPCLTEVMTILLPSHLFPDGSAQQ
jgi:hypothetical protein